MKSHIKIRYFIGVFLVLFAGLQTDEARAASSLRIVDMRWTHKISPEREPATRESLRSSPAGKALYLWVKLRGGSDDLETLKQKGTLTIVHKWEYTHFGWKTERIDVSIARDQALDDDTIQKLGYEVAAQGYFEWRTWSMKEHLYAHATVTLVNGFDEPLACELESGCSMTITIE